jgi:predicted kinase
MRKWMRERLKGRKKSSESSPAGPTQAPLQPAYFDQQAPEPFSASAMHETATEPAAPETEESQPVSRSERQQPEGTARREAGNQQKRRRRRGGRGRSRRAEQGNQPAQGDQAANQGAPEAPVKGEPETQIPAAVQSARPPKGVVVLAIGLPGSGKSSWFKRHNITPLSSDLLRSLLFDDPTEQRFQDLIFSNLRSMLKARLVARRPMNYVDATNLTPHDRHSWIKLGKDYGYEVQAVYFDVPVEVCLERNRRRERVVPEDVMRRFAEKLKPPTFDEGFSKITVVKVKAKKEAEES